MYAVIISGGRQYRVQKGDTLKIDSLPAEVGAEIDFDKVLLIAEDDTVKFGKPYLEGAKVTATVVSNGRHKKVHVIKFRRRKHHEKWQGHRQDYTEVEITAINA